MSGRGSSSTPAAAQHMQKAAEKNFAKVSVFFLSLFLSFTFFLVPGASVLEIFELLGTGSRKKISAKFFDFVSSSLVVSLLPR